MKKSLSTILIFFYLMSSIGYATMQRYCTIMQADVDMSENECCCSYESSESAESCQAPAENESHDLCCGPEAYQDQSSIPIEPETELAAAHSNCCKTHNEYNQLDDSTLSKVVDYSHAKIVLDETIIVDSRDYLLGNIEIKLFLDPSLRLNLPLLI